MSEPFLFRPHVVTSARALSSNRSAVQSSARRASCGVVDPCAHEEVVRAGKQLVLRLDDVQHPGRQCPERLQIARLVRLPGERLVFLEAVGQHLPHHVDVIVAEAGRVLVRVIRLLEQGRGLLELPLVVIYVAVAPRGRRADGVVGRAGVDDGFARTLIVFAVRVLVGGVKQDVPMPSRSSPVGSAVPALGILLVQSDSRPDPAPRSCRTAARRRSANCRWLRA